MSDEEKTTLVSRNVTVMGKRTSVRLEPQMWKALKEIADREKCTIHDICTLVKMRKDEGTSLTAAIRVFLMLYFRASSTEEGHIKANHGSFVMMASRAKIQTKDNDLFSLRVRQSNENRIDHIAKPLTPIIGRGESAVENTKSMQQLLRNVSAVS